MQKSSKLLTAVTVLVIVLFSLTAAIAAPILWRGWYVMQAKALGLSEATGFSMETILGAYDQVMGCLVWGKPFGTGALPYSESGMSHFLDCKVLFRLDFVVLTITTVLLIGALLAACFSPRFRAKMGSRPPKIALLTTAVVFLILGSWAIVDFDGLFTLFHHVFFPGKTNWVFSARTDPIILILPERFWANTAALVAVLTLCIEGALWGVWALLRRAFRPKTVYEELASLR